ncbi:MAG: cupin domain-containing protein [Simkania sp.]|nr:cupin domain-containing protein [Simkania sp.]MCP5489656.1 cupin domain-containing protein [Chlamydiales bacterium]
MEPVLLKSKEGKEYDIGTMVYRIKLRGTDTGGLFSLLDFNVYPGAIGPGDHYNENCSKTIFILSGKLKIKVADEEKELAPGELVYIPKKAVHDFANPYDNPCRFLLYISPAGLENFFEEAADSNPDEFIDLLKQYQIVMVRNQ